MNKKNIKSAAHFFEYIMFKAKEAKDVLITILEYLTYVAIVGVLIWLSWNIYFAGPDERLRKQLLLQDPKVTAFSPGINPKQYKILTRASGFIENTTNFSCNVDYDVNNNKIDKKQKLYIFFDFECPHCQELHKDIISIFNNRDINPGNAGDINKYKDIIEHYEIVNVHYPILSTASDDLHTWFHQAFIKGNIKGDNSKEYINRNKLACDTLDVMLAEIPRYQYMQIKLNELYVNYYKQKGKDLTSNDNDITDTSLTKEEMLELNSLKDNNSEWKSHKEYFQFITGIDANDLDNMNTAETKGQVLSNVDGGATHLAISATPTIIIQPGKRIVRGRLEKEDLVRFLRQEMIRFNTESNNQQKELN